MSILLQSGQRWYFEPPFVGIQTISSSGSVASVVACVVGSGSVASVVACVVGSGSVVASVSGSVVGGWVVSTVVGSVAGAVVGFVVGSDASCVAAVVGAVVGSIACPRDDEPSFPVGATSDATMSRTTAAIHRVLPTAFTLARSVSAALTGISRMESSANRMLDSEGRKISI